MERELTDQCFTCGEEVDFGVIYCPDCAQEMLEAHEAEISRDT